ncbi:MAG: hypothetical protein JEZ03_07210 [Bacteroidales bacterium]|nr:hypothetical protein [Bacteroidales bacterium]
MKPRRAFQKKRIAIGDTLPRQELHRSVFEKSSGIRRHKGKTEIPRHKDPVEVFYKGIIKYFIPAMIIIFAGYKIFFAKKKEEKAVTVNEINYSNKDIKTYNYLIKSGYSCIHENKPEKAIKD